MESTSGAAAAQRRALYRNGRGGAAATNESLPNGARFENRILSRLHEADFKRIEPILESVALAAGENIYQPEDPIRFVYFPETAVVSQFYILEDGRTMETAMVGREGATGHCALFGAGAAECFSQASVAGAAHRINAEILKLEFARGGSLRERLLEFASRYVAQISRGVVCNNYHSVERRFCTWLLMLCDRRGARRLDLTHSQIANYLGVHRPSFTHIAKNLREKEIINYTRGFLIVTNRDALLKSACDCYRKIF